jgi:hypothetical protein
MRKSFIETKVKSPNVIGFLGIDFSAPRARSGGFTRATRVLGRPTEGLSPEGVPTLLYGHPYIPHSTLSGIGETKRLNFIIQVFKLQDPNHGYDTVSYKFVDFHVGKNHSTYGRGRIFR